MTAAILIGLSVAAIGLFWWLGWWAGADRSALGAAEKETKRIAKEQADFSNTVEVAENATLAITDRASALASLQSRHPK